MIEATSCGGVVIFRGKILVLYKNYKNKYEGWVLPKGTVEAGEEYKETALDYAFYKKMEDLIYDQKSYAQKKGILSHLYRIISHHCADCIPAISCSQEKPALGFRRPALSLCATFIAWANAAYPSRFSGIFDSSEKSVR